MSNDATVTVRLPLQLKQKLKDIGVETERSASKVMILLLQRGIEAYEADGLLKDTRISTVKEPIPIRRAN